MQIIKPIAITDTEFVSSTVVETAPAAYAAGTTYGSGTDVTVASGDVLKVYRSLQAGNVGHTPSSSPTWWQYISDTYAEYSAATTYALGARCQMASSHKVYESLQAANLNHSPVTSPTYWLEIGTTNRWAMFDGKVGTKSTATDSIAVSVLPGGINALACMEVDADSIYVTLTDPTSGEVYSRTISVSSEADISDWFKYFFTPFSSSSDMVLTDLPAFSAATLDVTLFKMGKMVTCGMMIVGLLGDLGELQWEPQVSIIDYSRKEVDAFGNPTLTVRDYSKKLSADLLIDSSKVDAVYRLLAQFRATPLVWIGSELYSCMIIYGFYRGFAIVISGPVVSACSLEIEGLI